MASSNTADIIICGGSLAGLSAAIRLKQLGLSPLVLEKNHFPRKKLCGEFLGPDAFTHLQSLGIWQKVLDEGFGPVLRACFHGMHSHQKLWIDMAWLNSELPFGLGITRESLDWLMLCHARSLGVKIWEDCKVLQSKWDVSQQQFYLTLQNYENNSNRPVSLNTSILIDASGRHGGIVANTDFEEKSSMPQDNPPCDSKVGIKVNVSLPRVPEKNLHMIFFPGGYGGIQPLSGGTANVCILVDKQSARLIHQPFGDFINGTIGLNPYACEYLAGAKPIEPFQTTAHINLNGTRMSGYPLLRLGDAHITVDPITGSGMSLALETGIQAAEMVAEGLLERKPYAEIYRCFENAYQRRFRKRFWLLKSIRPFLHSESLRNVAWPLMPYLAKPLAQWVR